MSTFKVGQAVVCINAESANAPGPDYHYIPGELVLKQDGIYVVGEIEYEGDRELLSFREDPTYTFFDSYDFRPLTPDYEFVEEVIRQVSPKEKVY